MLTQRYDAIVVGVGGMGSAAAYHLAARGRRVLGIERFNIPHTMGSSHGETRIIRLAYYEDPSYVSLLRRAYELWRSLQSRAGEQLLHITGSIDAGPPGSWVFKGSLQSCLGHDLPHEVLSSRELSERFPGYRLPPETLAVFQPEGGYLLPERCIVSYVEAAQAAGAEIHGREHVLDWEPIDEGVRVVTDRAVYHGARLVLTAGAWTAQLLPFLADFAVPERQVLAWLQPTDLARFQPSVFPVFNLLVEEGRYYGFPVHGIPGFKFGKYHHFGETVDPDEYERDAYAEDEQALRAFAQRYFPDGAGPTLSLVTCLFTNTPDRHFLIDIHPEYPQVSFASPCSGHGYKFASVVGEIMADLAERGATRHDIDLFRLDRFGVSITRDGSAHPLDGRYRVADAGQRRPVAGGNRRERRPAARWDRERWPAGGGDRRERRQVRGSRRAPALPWSEANGHVSPIAEEDRGALHPFW